MFRLLKSLRETFSAKSFKGFRESFSAKIIALVVTSVFATAIVVGLATHRTTEKFLTEKISEKFPSVLNNTKSKLSIWYDRQFHEMDKLCQPMTFRVNLNRYLQNSDSTTIDMQTRMDLTKYLLYVNEKLLVYEELLLFTPKGELIAFTSEAVRNEADAVRAIIGDAGEAARFSPAIAGEEREHAYQWFWVPIAEEEEVFATMVARVNLEELTELLAGITLDRGGDLFLLNSDGLVLTQPRMAKTNQLWKKEGWAPTPQVSAPEERVLSRPVGKGRNSEGREVFRSVVPLPENSWWLVYEQDSKEAMAPVNYTLWRIWFAVLLIGAIFFLAAYQATQSILKPIRDLAQGAKRINEGLVGVKIPRRTNDDIGMMIETFNEMAQKISVSQAELQYKNKKLNTQNDQLQDMNVKLAQLSVTDGLTGLFNHRHFWNILNTELSRVNLYQGELALVLLDLDDFKRINDQFGHAVGDVLLQSVARILKQSVRDTDIVARYGGEEFAILLPDADWRGVQSVSEKLRTSVQALKFKVPETDIHLSVTVSAGVSVYRGNRREFFNAADGALYKSKSDGKNRVSYALV